MGGRPLNAAGAAGRGPGRAPDVTLRRPAPDDYAAIVTAADDWWGRRVVPGVLSRLWFEHFAGTSWLAQAAQGEPVGVLLAFASPDHPGDLVIVAAAVHPAWRRRGLGRRLHEAAEADAHAAGATRLVEPAWPGDPVAIAFLRAIGFAPEAGPDTRRLYGVPAYPDQEFGREDRAIMVKRLG